MNKEVFLSREGGSRRILGSSEEVDCYVAEHVAQDEKVVHVDMDNYFNSGCGSRTTGK